MERLTDVPPTKAYLRAPQRQGLRIGLVPTMGALHDGHLSLVRVAAERADVVVASVFVNPTQFGPDEDLDRYPRDLDGDAEKLARAGCHALFAPAAAAMYPDGFQTTVSVGLVTQGLEGAARPGHFDGVNTVVLKLLSIVAPDVAVFGEKDYQQLVSLRTMARDLALDVEIVGAPLVRDPDGLAMSSRNVYLTPGSRARALSLSRGLRAAEAAYQAGERDAAALLDIVHTSIEAAGIEAEYLELRRSSDLRPLYRADEPAVILAVVRVGDTRLLDNVILDRS